MIDLKTLNQVLPIYLSVTNNVIKMFRLVTDLNITNKEASGLITDTISLPNINLNIYRVDDNVLIQFLSKELNIKNMNYKFIDAVMEEIKVLPENKQKEIIKVALDGYDRGHIATDDNVSKMVSEALVIYIKHQIGDKETKSIKINIKDQMTVGGNKTKELKIDDLIIMSKHQ